eukprot:90506-Amorphochlora_amoeboformis.AAC.2
MEKETWRSASAIVAKGGRKSRASKPPRIEAYFHLQDLQQSATRCAGNSLQHAPGQVSFNHSGCAGGQVSFNHSGCAGEPHQLCHQQRHQMAPDERALNAWERVAYDTFIYLSLIHISEPTRPI